jgi:hypothetical protein
MKGRVRARGRHVPGEMNRLEKQYSEHLEARKQCGEVVAYWFERWKFKLADRTFYTPDFVVMLPAGELEAHEVKGFWEEDARVKAKVFADQFPMPLHGVTKPKRGSDWVIETFGG